MSEEKKSFIELLDPKSALILGVVGGLLTLGTIGFIIMSVIFFSGKNASPNTVKGVQTAGQNTPNALNNSPEVPKTSKPKVELFIMSYCPYGLQMQKAYLPVYDLLKNKADMSVKFVNYAMHGKMEVDENTRQYCIQKDQPSKLSAYLNCFFSAGRNDGSEADYNSCLTSAKVDKKALSNCIQSADKQFGITAKYDDRSSWLSGQFPIYPINDKENNEYGVQGSPTLIINGVQSEVNRTPEAVKEAICAAFDNPPAECGQSLSTTSFQAGFGTAAAGTAGANDPGCGTN